VPSLLSYTGLAQTHVAVTERVTTKINAHASRKQINKACFKVPIAVNLLALEAFHGRNQHLAQSIKQTLSAVTLEYAIV